MSDALRHGPRISGEELDRRTVELYEGIPAVPSREQRRQLRRQELDLVVDHRLGEDFPAERREKLWEVQERVERRRIALILRHAMRRVWPGWLKRGARGLAGYLVDEYAKVLTPQELESFFGEVESRRPDLPIDTGREP